MASVEGLFADIHKARSTPKHRRTAAKPVGLRSELRLEGITYRYPNAPRDSLTETSLTIRAGERIGIVGGTGAGKTTMADLILGLLWPTGGRILADEVPIDEENLRGWQKNVGYVPQEIFLIDATISENIAFGQRPEQIDQERVEEAARIAQLDTFVRQELPSGYDTKVGERGVRLSGGQRQRVGIARALYHKADLIVFDEATSALDNLTEREVMAAIEAVPGDKTILMIAHRLSTVKACDRIILLEQGQIVGVGSWDELNERNATFRKLTDAA
jgi:ABC-type multidrug transport system fused ATPase/permease subunit